MTAQGDSKKSAAPEGRLAKILKGEPRENGRRCIDVDTKDISGPIRKACVAALEQALVDGGALAATVTPPMPSF